MLEPVTKEISQGIFLIKQQIQNEGPRGDLLYIFKVEVKRLNVLEFTADFTGSENVVLKNSPQQNLRSVTIIQPYETQVVATLELKRDWKLKSQFRFTLKLPSKEIQEKAIIDKIKKLQQKIDNNREILRPYPLINMTTPEIQEILASKNLQEFIDCEFPPNDVKNNFPQ